MERAHLALVELMHESLGKLGLAGTWRAPQEHVLSTAQAFDSFIKDVARRVVVHERVGGGKRGPLRRGRPWLPPPASPSTDEHLQGCCFRIASSSVSM
jgi:hypothetical protein